MSDSRLVRRLAVVTQRRRRLLRLRMYTAVWLAAAAIALGLSLASPFAAAGWMALSMAAAAIVFGLWQLRARERDVQQAAILVERQHSGLDSKLLTALVQTREPGEKYSYLQEQVLTDVVDHARRHPWDEVIPTKRLWTWQCASLAALAVFVTTFFWVAPSSPGPNAAVAVGKQSPDGRSVTGLTVEPGDVELEIGSSLIVTARFAAEPPDHAELVTTDPDGNVQRWPLSRSLDDPLFGGRIPEVRSDLTYRVESAQELSAEFHVQTFEYPALLRSDAIIAPPKYAGRGEERIDDVRRVSVYEGSTLTFVCRFNKPLASAALQPDDGDPMPFGPATPVAETQDDPDDVSASVSWQPESSQTLELIVADDAGRGLKEPLKLHVEVLPNLPPELAVTFPSHDVQVSPLEELSLEATAWDDFGLREYGLVYRLPSGEERSVVLGDGDGAAANADTNLAHLLPLEELDPEARDLLSYSFYADDVDATGTLRRTYSDVFFAEVRHFDEEYREQRGQPGGGGGGGGGQQNPAQQLVDLQRQIVIATWNSFRNWTATQVADQSSKYRDEIHVLVESQLEARQQAADLAERLDDPVARQHAALAIEHMTAAHEQMAQAIDEPSVAQLTPARTEAQAAYQELLRLRDRLHVVTQQQGGGGGGGGSAAMDRQLSQLELRNDRNRYEQESQAQSPQEQQQQAELDVLSRLRELAQRQEDLNERIKELLDQRRTAQTDEEREEIERELKRLRDEQQELLRDADELRERMSQPQHQRQMADARQQLEQTRSDLQQSAEALESGQASRALTSGTRAQQRLQEMKDDFRRRTAGAFDEQVRELQQDARELADRQREIGEQLTAPEDGGEPQPTLRETDRRAEFSDSLAEQRERLSALLERMRELIEQSEMSEPLLSEHLYDAILDARQERPEDALRAAQELLRRGFAAEGTAAEQQARRGIEQLEQGINTAAESILGDELETLERAEQQVADLTRALQDELTQADPQQPTGRNARPSSTNEPGETANSQSDSGQRRTGEPTQQSDGSGEQPSEGERAGQSPDQRSPSGGESQTGGAGEQQSGQEQSGEAGQQPQQSASEQSGQSGGQQPGSNPGSGRGGSQSPREGQSRQSAGSSLADLFRTGGSESAGSNSGGRPLTGEDFTGWSDRLREVENMLSVPEMRAQAGAIRERARDVRRDYKRHSQAPDWQMVRTEIYGPLLELQTRLAEEIARRRPQDQIVPIDRDPVPEQYSDLVREYYERLSRVRPRAARDATTP